MWRLVSAFVLQPTMDKLSDELTAAEKELKEQQDPMETSKVKLQEQLKWLDVSHF